MGTACPENDPRTDVPATRRVVDGRIGVLGEDGAFDDDGAFHPLSVDFLDGDACGTEDAHGDAFVNEQLHGRRRAR